MQPDQVLDEDVVPTSDVGPWVPHNRRGPAADGGHPRSASSDVAVSSGLEPEALRHLARLLGRQAAREALRIRRHGGLGTLAVGVVLVVVTLALTALIWLAPHLHVGAWR